MDGRQETILIVEGDPRHLAAAKARLEQERYPVLSASSAADATEQYRRGPVSLILLGHRPFDGVDGVAVLTEVQAAGANVPVVVIADDGEIGSAIVAFQAGVRDYVGNSEASLAYLAAIVMRTLSDARVERCSADSEAAEIRTEAEEAIRRERDVTANILSCLPGTFYMYDESRRFLRWNRQFEIVTGYSAEEIRGMSPLDFFADSEKEILAEKIHNVFVNGFDEVEAHIQAKNGVRTPYYFNGARALIDGVPCLLGMGLDISERNRLEAQLLQAQKMEAIGQLAGGIAHDFNNLLTVINGYSEILVAGADMDDPNLDMLREVQRAGERAATLTSQLLAYSRRTIIEPKILDVNTVIDELRRMLRRLIGEDIQLKAELRRDLDSVKCDPHLLEQAITNLVVNARDAMPRGGELTIGARNTTVESAANDESVPPGSYVVIAVRDTGMGMTAAVKERIFEPFFTTKDRDKGTGLGLSMVFGFVRQSGGYVHVDSQPNQGSTFRIYLPAFTAAPGEKIPPRSRFADELPSATILLVEDEPAVRKFAKIVLTRLGYVVFDADGPGAACSILDEHADAIDLLITDVVMPQGTGIELAEAFHRTHPGKPVLFISGYTDDDILRRGLLHDEFYILRKPFSTAALIQKLGELLGA